MPLKGFNFEGYQSLDRSVGTRNILAIAKCLNRARSGLCGACAAMHIPTAIRIVPGGWRLAHSRR